MIIIGHQLIDGVPYINGKRAIEAPDPGLDCFIPWRCPECDAYLVKSGICANACHLSAAAYRRFNRGMQAIIQRMNHQP